MPYISVNDTEIYYEDAGSGQPVVLLHSWGTSGRVWGSVLPSLVADHRVLTVDARGCGRSGRPAAGNTINENTADVLELIRTLQLERPVIVGSSQGGTYAAEVAIRASGLIAGAVVIDGGGHWGLVTAGVSDRLAGLRAALIADRPAALQAWVPGWFGPAVGTGMHAWTIRQILDASPYIDPILSEQVGFDQRPRLPAVQVPVTWIHGELDTIPVSIAEESAELVPRGDVIVVDGAAHVPHLERPARFEQELRRALSAMR